MSDETLAKLAAMGLTNNSSSNAMVPGKKGKSKQAHVVEEAEEVAETEVEEEPVVNQKKAKAKTVVTANSKAKLDPETEMLVNYAKEKMQAERDELVEKLTANAEEDDVEELTETYNSMSIPQLKLLVKSMPKEKEVEQHQPVVNRQQMDARQIRQQERNYAGASGAVTPNPQQKRSLVNNGRQAAEVDFDDMPLETPTINHAEIAGFKDGRFVTGVDRN